MKRESTQKRETEENHSGYDFILSNVNASSAKAVLPTTITAITVTQSIALIFSFEAITTAQCSNEKIHFITNN